MAEPTTRQELIDHCLRRLGKPVVDINLDDDQIEDRVDDALQYFAELCFERLCKSESPALASERLSRQSKSGEQLKDCGLV